MSEFVKPYNNDPFVGNLSTPVTTSTATKIYLGNLPIYRKGLSPLLRGLEIGMAHGYFLIGPFTKLGPLRNSDIALFAGFLSTIGLILILTLGLTIYGAAVFKPEKESSEAGENDLQTRKAWDQFKGGFFVGACGSAGFALICLSIPADIFNNASSFLSTNVTGMLFFKRNKPFLPLPQAKSKTFLLHPRERIKVKCFINNSEAVPFKCPIY